jgi:hypothetical protein
MQALVLLLQTGQWYPGPRVRHNSPLADVNAYMLTSVAAGLHQGHHV